MNRLQAVSAGMYAETGRFNGIVHSVFARALNLSLDDGRLLSIIASEYGNAPNAVRVAAPPAFAFDRRVRPGDRAGCRAGVLRIDSANVEVRLDGVPRWHARPDGVAVDLGAPEVRAAWAMARRRIARHPANPGGRDAPVRRLATLHLAVRRRDTAATREAVRSLAGVGPGLTPTGDDMLVGFLAGLRAVARPGSSCDRIRRDMDNAVRDAAEHTNPVSAEYLRLAAVGAFSEPLAALAAAIARGAAAGLVAQATERALAIGASSGCDGVRAMLAAMRAAKRGNGAP